ncbi:hypothetical protein MFIFM68171_06796 [Madurella fahalii]|uniref:DUF1772-domain-containing protein n=1 Tax=Madurella fahalii TaxID=1157608 RepID=A0ABQ0GFP7_9PEZI
MPLVGLTLAAQWAGIAMPTLYAGITFQYSLTLPLLVHTSPDHKTLARQWLAVYQQGPVFVPPLICIGTLASAYLSYLNPPSSSFPSPRSSFLTAQTLYAAAAVLTLSIMPITFLYFEPGINGACKWKVQRLLEQDGFRMPEGEKGRIPRVDRHSASEASKEWAERAEMGELVRSWVRRNHGRWVVGLLAGGLSGLATGMAMMAGRW